MRSFIFLLVLLPFTNGVLKGYKSFSCDTDKLEHTDNYFPTLLQINFIKCENITSLSFSRNYIRKINNDTFKYLKKIKNIDFSFNNISTLPTEIFNSTPQIEDINFSYNNFTFLQKNLFANLSTLASVNFQFNKIEYVDEKCFVNVSTLTVINLANNNLKTLQFNIIDDIKSLKKIYLSGNPWHCDPNLCETMNIMVSKFWQDEPVCNTPDQIRNSTWKQFVEQPIPVIIGKLKHKEYDQNNSITLQCHSCSKTSLVWLFENKPFFYATNQTSAENLTLSTFTIDPLTVFDFGNYTCFANKNTPQTSDWAIVYVQDVALDDLVKLPDLPKIKIKLDVDSGLSHGRIIAIFVPVASIFSLFVRFYYMYARRQGNEPLFSFIRFFN